MSKFFLLVAVIIAIYLAVKILARKRREQERTAVEEQMVPCAHCRVNLPRSEAIEAGGRFYCTEEHRRLGDA